MYGLLKTTFDLSPEGERFGFFIAENDCESLTY
jgi:hypothetical protein